MSVSSSLATKPMVTNLAVLQSMPTTEGIRCLLDALQTADQALVERIENQLVSIGEKALSLVLKGLTSSHQQVQATCAIVLVRWQAASELKLWAKRHPQFSWLSQELLLLMGIVVEPSVTVLPNSCQYELQAV